jgi:DNA-binding SARP family transcriptional activator
MLKIVLFGHPKVIMDAQPVSLVRRKTRALLYYVAASPRPVQREKLLSIFWPDQPRASGLQTLRTTLHSLRSQLGPWLIASDEAIALLDEVDVDVRTVDELLSSAEPVKEQLVQAVAAYPGDFLDGFSLPDSSAFEDWVTYQRAYYQRLIVRALTRLSQIYQAAGDYQQALDSLEEGLRFNPLQEDLQRESMRLYYLAGDRPGAIRKYDELRRLLDEEMGVPPMVETRALYDEILNDRLATSLPRPTPAFQPRAAARRFTIDQAADFEPNRLPFTGRSNEFEMIRQGLQAGQMVLIEGQAGIGKTRLAEEYLSQTKGIHLVGRGRELEQGLPYQPLIEALRSLVRRADWVQLQIDLRRRMPSVWLAEINRLAPGLFGSDFAPAGQTMTADEARLWQGTAQLFMTLSSLQLVLLFIDDLHWADASTVGLMGYLTRLASGSALGILAAARPAVPRSAHLALTQSLGRENRLRRLSLSRLDFDEVRRIAEGFSQEHAQVLADWLWRNSEGSPFILAELVQHAHEYHWLKKNGEVDLQQIAAGLTIPRSVYELITIRLGRLSDAARRMLDAGVAAGREFEFEVVLRAAGLSESAGLDALDELGAAGFVSALDSQRLIFDHPLTMEVAYQEVGELRHRLMHRRIAEALESIHPDRLQEIAGTLAWHYSEGNDLERAAPYAVWAARQAGQLAAWNEAIALYRQALQGIPAQERLPILVLLGEAYLKFGKFSQASETLHEALVMAEAQAEITLANSIRLILARSLLPQARYAEASELAQHVSRCENLELAMQAELLLGTAYSVEGADLEAAGQHLMAAQARWELLHQPDPALLAQIQFELGSVFAQRGDLAQAVLWYQHSLESASRSETDLAIQQRVLAYNNLAYHMLLAEDQRAGEFVQKGLKLAQEKGLVGMQAYLFSTQGEIFLAQGDLAEAESCFNAGLQIAEQFTVPERVAGLHANLGLVASRRGDTPLAIHLLSRALSEADGLGTPHLAAQIRIWLAPLLPAEERRLMLAEAQAFAQASSRQRLLEQIQRLEPGLRID